MSKSTAAPLFLASGTSVEVHPVVLLSVLDFYTRRPTDADRVIGALLGTSTGSKVEVTNCFAVPHQVSEQGKVSLAIDLFNEMLSLRQRVNPEERVVGWYATALGNAAVTETSCEMHEFFASECDPSHEPVLLVVDAALSRATLEAKAFVTIPLEFVEKTLVSQFRRVPVLVSMSQAERVGVTRMLEGRTEALAADTGGVSELAGDLESLETAMEKLLEVIDSSCAYVDGVVARGATPADTPMGRRIADALSAVPSVPEAEFRQVFENNVQDLLMVGYLSTLTRAQLAISEKLNFS